jgi:Holliday junction DNA helicase RuvA
MIGMLTGTCLVKGEGEIIIDVNGVGYLVQCASKTSADISVGEIVCMHIETHVREQAITLYAFETEDERSWFVHLQSVQGVGPKAALAILDILSPSQIFSSASLGDKNAFAQAKGIGPKSASRIASELASKPLPRTRGLFSLNSSESDSHLLHPDSKKIENAQLTQRNDAISALKNLGVGQSDALRAVARAYDIIDGAPLLDDLIKLALKELSK